MTAQPDSLFIGKPLIHLESIDSTNNFALELLTKNKPNEGTAVATYHQSEGRGQIGKFWESESHKNILLSVILYPHFLPLSRQFYLNMSISLGIRDFVDRFTGEHCQVKWPNDIYIGQDKIAGILIQNGIANSRIEHSVVGLGININQEQFSSTIPNPTSLAILNGTRYLLSDMYKYLFYDLEKRYLQLKAEKWEDLRMEYLEYLYLMHQNHSFQTRQGMAIEGKIVDVQHNGKLIIKTKEDILVFDFREIIF